MVGVGSISSYNGGCCRECYSFKSSPSHVVEGEVQVGVPRVQVGVLRPPSHDGLSYGWECSSSKCFPHHRSGEEGAGVPSIMLAIITITIVIEMNM